MNERTKIKLRKVEKKLWDAYHELENFEDVDYHDLGEAIEQVSESIDEVCSDED